MGWQSTKIHNKAKYYHRGIIKESLCTNAFRAEKLMNVEDAKPINPNWKLGNYQTFDLQDCVHMYFLTAFAFSEFVFFE